jgi:hypothetical protein
MCTAVPSRSSAQVPVHSDVIRARKRTASESAGRPVSSRPLRPKTSDRPPSSAVASSRQTEARSVPTGSPSRSTGSTPFAAPAVPALPSSSTAPPQPIPGAPMTLCPVTR